MSAAGELTLDGERLQVEGIAWFDHQWGDFVSVGGGGWDWFAINLDDGTDITLLDRARTSTSSRSCNTGPSSDPPAR